MRRYLKITALLCAIFAVIATGYTVLRSSRLSKQLDEPATRVAGDLDSPLRSPQARKSRPDTPNDVRPLVGKEAQAFARRSFGEFSHRVDSVLPVGWNATKPSLIFLTSHYSGEPGLCEVTTLDIPGLKGGDLRSQNRFLVIGAFKYGDDVAKRRLNLDAYNAKVEASCASRPGSLDWFTSDGITAGDGAAVLDSTIAAARASWMLHFKINCDNQIGDEADISLCKDGCREIAKIDPRDIQNMVSVDDFTTSIYLKRKSAFRKIPFEMHLARYQEHVIPSLDGRDSQGLASGGEL
jgi:hypothetical protein